MSDQLVCQSKTPYSRREAKTVMRHMSGRGRTAQAYKCRHCGKFHITSTKNIRGVGRTRNELE